MFKILTSKESLLQYGAAFSAIRTPVTVPPVNDNIGTFGCVTNASPARGPSPYTMLHTPLGSPIVNETCR